MCEPEVRPQGCQGPVLSQAPCLPSRPEPGQGRASPALQPGPTYPRERWRTIPPPTRVPATRAARVSITETKPWLKDGVSTPITQTLTTWTVSSLSDSASAGWALGPPSPLVTYPTVPSSGTSARRHHPAAPYRTYASSLVCA
uniref:Uncharacterized protein n=1 Tax=Molossus molossus TaxID=27622 RepID=A0A7J8EDY6_MOLMO|nr:hypothetical protein HJG59_008804 [Molossus molossus]